MEKNIRETPLVFIIHIFVIINFDNTAIFINLQMKKEKIILSLKGKRLKEIIF